MPLLSALSFSRGLLHRKPGTAVCHGAGIYLCHGIVIGAIYGSQHMKWVTYHKAIFKVEKQNKGF